MSSSISDLRALLKQSPLDNHELVLRACNAVLRQDKGDLEAQHIKVIALLKSERYDDALRALEAGGDRLKQSALLERAYALYKIGSLKEANELAKSIKASRGARHVEAQASYRLEDFSNAANIYRELAEAGASNYDEENDVRINSGATDAQLEWKHQGDSVQKKKPSREDLEVFETAYNAACGAIARDELGQSEVLLNRARDLCSTLDELSERQKTEEILSINVQQVYVLSRMGKLEEAERLASDSPFSDIIDHTTRQIGQNNKLASLTSTPNPFLAHRILQEAVAPQKPDQLFSYQAVTMSENRLASDLLVGKRSGVLKSTLKALSSQQCSTDRHTNKLSVLHAAAHSQSDLGNIGLRKILPLLEKRPMDVGLTLTVIQLYILTNNVGSALTVMESLLDRLASSSDPNHQDVRFAPGLTSILVSLYKKQNRKSQVISALSKAASYWRHKQKPPIALLQAAGVQLLTSSKGEDQDLARELFSILRSSEPTSRFATAGYVAAHAATCPDKVKSEADSLTSIPRLVADVPVFGLEKAGVPFPPADDVLTTKRKRALDDKPKSAKKRVRKSRLPKDLDVNKAVDPERWLPLRDRSSYKPKGKKGKKKAEALTQGGMTGGSKDNTKAGGEGVLQAKSGGGGKKRKGKK